MQEPVTIRISDISHHGYTVHTAPRGATYVLLLANAVLRSFAVPPIEVFEISGGPKKYAIKNGNHRIAAHLLLGFETIPALIATEFDGVSP